MNKTNRRARRYLALTNRQVVYGLSTYGDCRHRKPKVLNLVDGEASSLRDNMVIHRSRRAMS